MEISFEHGIPQAVDGEAMNGIALINHLNGIAGEHGVGRIDHLEDRLVGIKSREVYEAPAGRALHAAHRALESITLSKDQLRFKEKVALEYAEMVYNGLWFTGFHQDLDAYVQNTQRHVTGTVRLKMFKGSCTVVGRSSPYSLYRHDLATYDTGDRFDHRASEGVHPHLRAGRPHPGQSAAHRPSGPGGGGRVGAGRPPVVIHLNRRAKMALLEALICQ